MTPTTLLGLQRDPLLGEDTRELFEVIEDSFAVDLGDYRALCGMTVKVIAGIICHEANYPPEEKCLPAVAFSRLRSAFGNLAGVQRKMIHPSTPVARLLPWRSRKADWSTIQVQLGLKLPNLRVPAWLSLLALVVPACLLISLRAFWGFPLSGGMILFGSFALILPAWAATMLFARSLPPNCETFGRLAEVALARNHAVFASQAGSPSESGAITALRQLIALQLGVDLATITAETQIPQDLKIY
jgi:hypothetical protein